jgi:hypothetical protein
MISVSVRWQIVRNPPRGARQRAGAGERVLSPGEIANIPQGQALVLVGAGWSLVQLVARVPGRAERLYAERPARLRIAPPVGELPVVVPGGQS